VTERFDVAIVGGRVGGATLASLLGRRGLRVLLLDQARFPSDTLSTHVIFGDSFSVWSEIGAWPRIEAIGAAEMVRILWNREPPSTDIHGPVLPSAGFPFSLCLRRILLDEILFRTAQETPGVTAWEGTQMTELVWRDGRVCGLRYERRGARTRGEVQADLVVGADGRFSSVAAAVGAATYNRVPPLFFPFYTYVRGTEPLDPPAFEVYESPAAGGTIMLTPCDDGISMVVIYTAQADLAHWEGRHAETFRSRLASEPRLAGRLEQAELVAPIRGRTDIENFLRVAAGPGWALVGDAGQHKDPIWGQGIGDAVRTARLLADIAPRALGAEGELESALAEFHAYRDRDLLPGYDFLIRRRARGLDDDEVDRFFRLVGRDPELSARVLGLFSHAELVDDVVSPSLVRPWLEAEDHEPVGSGVG
jgi:2-polyprenyl-6-methoxyphenol hydroxylase-like FAD-dependent oxidoreductase